MDDRYAQLRIPDHVVYREMDGALVLTSLKAGGFLRLDQIGERIWRALERGAGCEAVVADLTDAYDVSPDECRRDVTAFLDDLAARQFVDLGASR